MKSKLLNTIPDIPKCTGSFSWLEWLQSIRHIIGRIIDFIEFGDIYRNLRTNRVKKKFQLANAYTAVYERRGEIMYSFTIPWCAPLMFFLSLHFQIKNIFLIQPNYRVARFLCATLKQFMG